MCEDVLDVMENNACIELFDSRKVMDGNETRIDNFKENMFSYMKQNVALVNVYIKEPYCVKIGQSIKFPM